MGTDRTAVAENQKKIPVSRAQATGQSQSPDRNLVCAQDGHRLGVPATGNGLRFRYELLATAAGMATSRRLAKSTRIIVGQTPQCRQNRLVQGSSRFRFSSCSIGRKKTGPNPTDKGKAGSKHHLIVDGQGIPLAAILTGANRHDVTQLLPLVDAVPAVRGKRGRPRSRPQIVQGDRGYDSQPHRYTL